MLIEPSHGLLIETDVLSKFVCMLFAFTQDLLNIVVGVLMHESMQNFIHRG